MGLFDFLKKEAPTSAYGFKSSLTDKRRKKANIRLKIYDENGNEIKSTQTDGKDIKPIQYYETIRNEIKPLEEIMVSFAVASKEQKQVDDRIEVLKALLQSYYDLKSKCISLGPDYQEYFINMWEKCHNSRNPEFSYIDRFEKELNDLQSKRDTLKSEEELHQKESEGLEDRVIAILRENSSILQTDIYKNFDPIVQNDIQSILYFMAKNGRITREKSGRTYMIHFVK